MLGLGDEMQEISSYPAADFVESRVRTCTSGIPPDDASSAPVSVEPSSVSWLS
jgi:hypothetical protein